MRWGSGLIILGQVLAAGERALGLSTHAGKIETVWVTVDGMGAITLIGLAIALLPVVLKILEKRKK